MADTILGALNDLIQKLDDLDTQDELSSLGDKIDTLAERISPTGQSIQNTLHAGMISGDGAPYLQNLTELSKMRRAIANCCSSSLTGEPLDDLPPVEVSRKCKMANLIWDNTYQVFNQLEIDHADLYATGLTSGMLTIVLGTITASIVNPVVGVAVALTALVVAFLVGAGSLSLPDMLQSLTSNKNNIICGLLKATNASDARDVFQNEMTNVTNVELFFINLLLSNDMLNNLFNAVEPPADYTPGYDCADCSGGSGGDGCSDCGDFGAVTLVDGLVLSAIYNSTTDRFEINAAFNDYYTFEWEVTAGVAYLNGHLECACGGMGANCCSSVMFYGSDGFDVTFSNVQVTTFNDCICA